MTEKSGYRADIDGLRALSIVFVLLFHSGLVLPGGFIGVDVFFVISGYLITRNIFEQIRQGQFKVFHFWRRRASRLLPAVFTTYVICLCVGYWVLLPADLVNLAQSCLSSVLLCSNLYFWKTSNYFSGGSETKPLLHTWSLSVEEQFYIVYPGVLLFAYSSLKSKGKLVTALKIGFLLSFILCLGVCSTRPTAGFYWLPSRGWELLMGGILALSKVKKPDGPLLRGCFSLGALPLLITCALLLNDRTPFPSYFALAPCVATLVIIWVGEWPEVSPLTRMLSWAPLVELGKRSYSIYLIHWPIFAYVRYWSLGTLSAPVASSLILLSIIIGGLSYSLVEGPLRHSPRAWPYLASLLSVVTCLTLLAILTEGFPKRVPDSSKHLVALAEPIRKFDWVTPERVRSNTAPILGTSQQTPNFLVWGDSMSWSLAPGFSKAAKDCRKTGTLIWAPSNPPFQLARGREPGIMAVMNSSEQAAYTESVFELVERTKPQRIYLFARWSSYLSDDSDADQLQASIDRLRRSSGGIYLIREIPSFAVDVPRALLRGSFLGLSSGDVLISSQVFGKKIRRADQFIASLRGVGLLDPAPLFQDKDGNYCGNKGLAPYFIDSLHLSSEGCELLTPLLKSSLESL